MSEPSGSGTGGGGYNIPVSLSRSQSTALPQNVAAGTVFNFGSVGGDLGDVVDQEANPTLPSTATSSAALGGDATSQTSGSGVMTGGNNALLLVSIGVATVAIIATIYLTRK